MFLFTLLITAQPFKLPRQFLKFFRKGALPRRAATRRLFGRSLTTLTFGLGELTFGQFLQALGHLVHFLVTRGTTTLLGLTGALLQFVLIRQAIPFQFKEVREVFGHRAATTAASATALLLLTLTHLALVGGLGVLQEFQRLIFRRECFLGLLGAQLLLGRIHRLRRLLERLENGLELGVATEALRHLLHERRNLVLQLRLGQRNDDRVLLELLRRHLRLVAIEVKRRGDHLALLLRERALLLSSATATTAATFLRLAWTERLLERTDFHEVDVTHRDLRPRHAVVVRCHRVVGDRVAHLDVEFFEIHGVSGRHVVARCGARAEHPDGLFFAAVHRIHQVQRLHTEVVCRCRLEEHFLDGAGGRIATGFDELHRRRHVLNHIDRVGG